MLFINFLCLLYLMVLSNGYTITKSIDKEDIIEVSNAVTKLDNTKNYGTLHQRYRREQKATKQHNVNKNTKIYSKAFTSAPTITAVTLTPTIERLKHKSPKRKLSDFWRKYKGKKGTNESKKGSKKEGKRRDKDIQHNIAHKATKDKHRKTINKQEHVGKNPMNSKQNVAIHSTTRRHAEKNNKKNKRSFHLLRRSETATLKRDIKTKTTAKKIKAVSAIRIGITPQAVVMSKSGVKNHTKLTKIKTNDDIKNIISSISPQLANKKKKYKFTNYDTVSPNYERQKAPSKTATRPTAGLDPTSELDFLKTAQIEDILNNIKFKTIQMISESNSTLSDMIINSGTEKFFTVEPFLIQMPSTVSQQSLLKLVAINDGNKFKENVYKERALNRTVTIGYGEPHDMFARSLTANTIEIAYNVADNIQQQIKNVIKKVKAKVSNSYKNSTIQSVTKKMLHKMKMQNSKFSKSSPMKPLNSKFAAKNTSPHTPSRPTRTNKIKHAKTMKLHRSIPTFDDTVMPLYEDMLEKSQQEIAAKKKTSKLPFIKKDKKYHRLHKRSHDTYTNVRRINDIVYDKNLDDYVEPDSMLANDSVTTTTMSPIEGTDYNRLSNKISYSDYVNGYKHYLQFQKDQANDKFSAMVKYQAHKHHNVDDIGKYILEKIPTVPTFNYLKSGQRHKRFFDDNDIDDQEISTKTDESWFKKHFYLFIDNVPPKKFRTSQTISLKSPLTELPYMERKATQKSRQEEQFYMQLGGDRSDSTPNDNVYDEPTLDYLSGTLDNRKANKLLVPNSQGKCPATNESVVSLYYDVSNVTNKPSQLNFIAQLFGKKYSRTLKTGIRQTTLDTGERIKRASHDKCKNSDSTTEYETEVTAALAKATKADSNTQHKKKHSNRHGYVDINLLVPKGTAVVKLRENSTNKSKFKEFFKKFRFKSKEKNKRSCNPFKKLKDIFKQKDDKYKSTKPLVPIDKNKHQHNYSSTISPHTKSVYDVAGKKTTHPKSFTHTKVGSLDDIRKHVPNINNTGIDDTAWTSTIPLPKFKDHMKESLKEIKKDKEIIPKTTSSTTYTTAKNFSDDSWLPTTPLPGHKSDLEDSQRDKSLTKLDKKHHEVIFVKPMNSTYGSTTPETKSDTSLEITDSVSASRTAMDSVMTAPNKDDSDVFSVTVMKAIDEPNRTMSPSEAGEDYDNLELNFAKYNSLARGVGTKQERTAQNDVQAAAIEKTVMQNEKRESTTKTKVTRYIKIPRIHYNLNRKQQLLRQCFSIDDISANLDSVENDKYVPEIKYGEQQTDLIQNSINKLIIKDASSDEYKKPDYFDDLINWHGDILNKDKVQTPSWNKIVKEVHHDLKQSLATPSVHDMMNELKKFNTITELNAHKYLQPTVTITNMYDVNENKKAFINNLALNDKPVTNNKNSEAQIFKFNRPMVTDSKISNISQSSNRIRSFDEYPVSGYDTRLKNRDLSMPRDRYSVARDWVNKLVTANRFPETSSIVPERETSDNVHLPLVTVTLVTDQSSNFKTDLDPDWMSPDDIYVKDMGRGYTKQTPASGSTPAFIIDTALLPYDDEVQNVANGLHVKKLSRNSWRGQSNNLITTQENLMTKLNKQPPQCYTTPLPMKPKDFEKFLKDGGMDPKSLTEPIKETTTKDFAPKQDTKGNIITLLNVTKQDKNLKSKSYITKALHAKTSTNIPLTLEFNDRYKRLVKNSDNDTTDDFDHSRLKKNNIFGKILHNVDETTFETMRQVADNISLAISNLHEKAKELPIIDISDLNYDLSMKNTIPKEDNNINIDSNGPLIDPNLGNIYNGLAIHNHLLYNNQMHHGTHLDNKNNKNTPTMSKCFTVPFVNVYRSAECSQKSPRKQPKKVQINSHHYKYDIFYADSDNDNVEITHKRGIQPALKVDRIYMKLPKISERPNLYKTAEQSKIYGTRQRIRRGWRRLIRKVNAPEKSSSPTVEGKTGSGITESTTPRSQKRILDVLSSKFITYTAEPVYKLMNNKVIHSASNEGFVIKVERGNSTTTTKIVHETKSKDPKWLTISVHPNGKFTDDKEIFINDIPFDRRNSGFLSKQLNFLNTLNIDNLETTEKLKISEPYNSRVEDTPGENFKESVTELSNIYNDKNDIDNSEKKAIDMIKFIKPNINNISSKYTKLDQEFETSHSTTKDKIISALDDFANSLFLNHFKATVKVPDRDQEGINTPIPRRSFESQQSAQMEIRSTLNPEDTRISRFIYFEPISDKVQQIYVYNNNSKQFDDDSAKKKNLDKESLEQQKVTSANENLHFDKKRDIQSQEVFTAKDVAALEVIVDLMKNTLSYEDKDIASVFSNNLMLGPPVKSVQQSQDSTNSIQVHIAIPFDIQPGKKRSALEPMRVRRVFSAKMSSPVDLEYQIHSFEEMPDSTTAISTTTADDGLSPGMYLLIDKPNNGYALKPLKAKIDLSNVGYRQITTTPLNKQQESTRRDDIKEMGKVTLSKNLISAINKQLAEMYENFTTSRSGAKRVRKKRAVHRAPVYFRRRGTRTKGIKKLYRSSPVDSSYRVRRVIDWDALQNYFGQNRVCNCKCKPYKPMCRACAASDVVMNELIFEFNNIEQYMRDHCTELQTYFWMNPSGGLRLRDTVHNIDKSLNDYYKRVRGKCQGKTCKAFGTNIDKREFIKSVIVPKDSDGRQITIDLASLANDLNRIVRMSTCFNRRLSEEGGKMLHAINACIFHKNFEKRSEALTTKKKLIKNVYSLDNINVNIICNPDAQNTENLEPPVGVTTTTTATSRNTTASSSTNTMPTTSTSHGSSNNIISSTTITTTASITSSITAQNEILTSGKSQDRENLFEFDFDEDSGKPKKRKCFKYLFPRRKKKDKLFTYYTIDTTPKPLFKRDTYNQLEIPLISDGGGRFWFDYLHSSSTSEIVSAREIKQQDLNPKHGTTVLGSTIATSTKCKFKNIPIINEATQRSENMKTQIKDLKKSSTQRVTNMHSINAEVNVTKATSTETGSELVAEYLSDDINQFMKLFGDMQDIESMNKNSNRSTQFIKYTEKQDNEIADKPTSAAMLKLKTSTNFQRKNKTTTSIRTTEKVNETSVISNKATILKRKSTSTAPLSLENLEKEVSAVYSSKVTGYSKKITSKKHTRTGKKHTKSNSKKTKASTHRSVTIVSKENESSTTSSLASTRTKDMNTASQQTIQHTDSTNNPMSTINKITSLTDITTITASKKDKITKKLSRKIQKPNIFGQLKSVTLRFLGLTRHDTETTTEIEQKSYNALVENIKKAEIKPISAGYLTEVPMHQDPSILTFDDYDNQLSRDLGRHARKSDYKNILLSIIQYESNKLKEEWNKLAYGSDDALKDSSKLPPAHKHPPTPEDLFRGNDNTKKTMKNLQATKVDIIEDVSNIPDLEMAEPVETINFDLNRYMKRPGLLDKIANKMGIKIISVDKTTEKAAKQSYSTKAELKADKNKHEDPKKAINPREASDPYQPNKFVCDLQSTYNHVTQLRNELMQKEFEAYVKKIPCYKYKRIPRNFFINHRTGGLKWDWIRNKRSLIHRARYRTREERMNDDDDNSKNYCDVFETFIKDDDGIYRVGSRRKRSSDDTNEEVDLMSLPPILPSTNEVFFMVDDSIALDCLVHHDVRSVEPQGQYTWEAERKDMLEQDNVQVDGPNLLIRKAGAKNSGTYSCSVDDIVRRKVRVVVVTLPFVDVVFMPVYKLPRECNYHDLKAIQLLAQEMSKEISCGNVCSVRIDDPVCQMDRATNRSHIRSTTVLSLTPRRVRCSVQCRRDLHSSMVRLSAANVPALRNTNVVLSRDGVNDTLSPCKDVSNTLITHKLRKKDSSSHHKYRRLTDMVDPDKMHIVVVCGAGYYLMHGQNICAPCPSNTSSASGENSCTPCPKGTSSDPGSKECHKHHKRHSRYDWWWYPPCGYMVAGAAVVVCCGLCVLLSLVVQLVDRRGGLPHRDGYTTRQGKKASTVCGHVHYSTKRPLSPSRVILARFFKPSLTSSRATAVDSQETRFEMWKERNIPPPLPPIDFDLDST